MAMIIAVCEANSLKVKVSDRGTAVEHLGESISFKLSEKVSQYELPPGSRGMYDFGPTFAGKPVDYKPTGLLCLQILEYNDLRKRWNDTDHKKVEDAIPEFVAMLIKSAVVRHRRTEDFRAAELERQRQAAERERLREEIEAETQRRDDLLKMSENWRQAHTLRQFLEACQNLRSSRNNDDQKPKEEFENWLQWAYAHADRLDPLVDSPPSILDRADDL